MADHRTGYKASNLPQVLAGDLGELIDSSRRAEREARLAEAARETADGQTEERR